MTNGQARLEDDRVVDVRQLLACVWARKLLVAACVVAVAVASAVAALVMTPVYRAGVVFIPASTDASGFGGDLGSALARFGGLASIVGINPTGSGSQTDEALAVLTSRQFIGRFIEDNGLMPVLYSSVWDNAAGSWATEKPPTAAKAYKLFRQMLTVTPDRESGVITLQLEWKEPVQAAMWANALLDRLNGEMRERAIKQTAAMVEYLEAELAATSVVEVREAINSLIEAQIKQRMLANVTREYAFRVVDPATVPDLDEPVRPRRRLMVGLGAAIGVGLGVIAALVLSLVSGELGGSPRRRKA